MQELSERQLEIVRATIALISEDGVHNFSIRKLARRVGVTEPAVYRHFESKDDLMIKLATHIVHNWHELLGMMEVKRLPVIEQTRRIFSEVMSYFSENKAFTKTLFSVDLYANNSAMAGILVQLKNDGLLRFSELLAEGQTSGEIPKEVDVMGVSKIFFGSVWWVVSDWIADQYSHDLTAAWDTVCTSLFRLLLGKA